jgi:hypothetical protein
MRHFLAIENDPAVRPLLEFVLENAFPDGAVRWVQSEAAADRALREESGPSFDAVISDVRGRPAIELWRRHSHRGIHFLFISGMIHPEGRCRFICKSRWIPAS